MKKTVETVPLSLRPVITGLKPGVNERSDFLVKAQFSLFVAPPNLDPLPAKTPRVKGPGAWTQQRNGNAEAGQQNTDPWILMV
jgi:hypothetical protein